MQIKALVTSTIAALAVLTSTHAWSVPKTQPQKAIEGAMLVQEIGIVKSVDTATRRITVATQQGTTSEWNLAESGKDLSAIPLDSRVTRLEAEPASLLLVKTGAVQEVIPGDKQFVLRVVSTDSASGVIQLKDANDLPFQVRTLDPKQAAKFATGSLIKVMLDGKK